MKRPFLTFILCFVLSGIVHTQEQTDTLNLFFDIDQSVIDDNKAKLLDKHFSDKNVIITIYGYTDFLGSTAYNQQLSEKRSANVRNYLISKGINKKNIIISKGEGIHPNSVEENRRDSSDKGIQAHRMVRVVYSAKPPTAGVDNEESSDEKEVVVPSKSQPIDIKGSDNEVCEGDQVRLTLDREYKATNFRWEKSPNNAAPWVPVGKNAKTILEEVNTTTWYRCKVDEFMSEAFKVTVIKACE